MLQLVPFQCSIRVAGFPLITPSATKPLAGTASRPKRTAFKALGARVGGFAPESHRSSPGGGTAMNDPNPPLELGEVTGLWPPPGRNPGTDAAIRTSLLRHA